MEEAAVTGELDRVKRDFVLVDPSTSIGQTWDRIRSLPNLWVYVVVRVLGRYSVFRLDELIDALRATHPSYDRSVRSLPVERMSDLLTRCTVETVEETGLSSGKVRALFRGDPDGRWVLLKQGTVTGVLADEKRGTAKLDLKWLEPTASRAMPSPQAPPKPPPAPPPPGAPPPPAPATEPESYTLSDDDTGGAGSPLTLGGGGGGGASAPPEPAPPPEEKRYINAWLDPKAPAGGLKAGAEYTIAFNVDVGARTDAVAAQPFAGTFAPGEEEIEVTVQLSSDDFQIKTEPQKFHVPRRGKSRDAARFAFVPKHDGKGTMQAVFLKNGNFIQLVNIHLDVGAAEPRMASESLGRPLDAGFELRPRDLSILLEPEGDGFRATLTGPVTAYAKIAITRAELDQMITQARDSLLSIVKAAAPGGELVYQKGITIPEAVNQDALKIVAKAGFRLFQRMFFGPAADAQAKRIGQALREMARKERLKIQINSKDFLMPWGILYMADTFDPDHVDPDLFLGFKHIVEHIPLQQAFHVTTTEIDGRSRFTVSLNLNSDIDAKMGIDVIARQRDYWKSAGHNTVVTIRDSDRDVMTALKDPSLPDQMLYFYCHASSQSLGQGGPDASALVFRDGKLTLGDLAISAPMDTVLQGSPLVFINACESAELSPLFYDGFVPYFMGKGARGVIGTECLTPALFAAEWAKAFFDRFLEGKPVGEIFLDLRKSFFQEHHNLLGLLYALYCDGDTQLIAA